MPQPDVFFEITRFAMKRNVVNSGFLPPKKKSRR